MHTMRFKDRNLSRTLKLDVHLYVAIKAYSKIASKACSKIEMFAVLLVLRATDIIIG